MRISFVGKRHYTNQDALSEGFGRIVQLPLAWSRTGHAVQLSLVDYHSHRPETAVFGDLPVNSFPLWSPASTLRLTMAVQAFRPDVIVASGDCFIGLFALQLARRTGARFVFDVYDDYRTFGAYRAFLGWDALGFLCRSADAVSYASSVMAGSHGFESVAVLVPNGVDARFFRPIPRHAARAELGLAPEGVLIGYFGSMTPEHGVPVLIRAFTKLRERRPDARLLLCGRIEESVCIDVEGVVYRGLVEHRFIPWYMNACDVLTLPYLRGRFLDHASSCKIAEYLFCRRPIVATDTPNFVENFPSQARALGTLLVTPGDPEALAGAIGRQLEDPLVVEPPGDMTWTAIAERALASFRQIVATDPVSSRAH
jgi:glycosyltransferase involved in cell wall biosynthesis